MEIYKKSTLRENTVHHCAAQEEGAVTKPSIFWFKSLHSDTDAYVVENYNNLFDILEAWEWAVRFLSESDHETLFPAYLVITDISHHMNPFLEWDDNMICPFRKPRWEGIRIIALKCELNTKFILYSTACWTKDSSQFLLLKFQQKVWYTVFTVAFYLVIVLFPRTRVCSGCLIFQINGIFHLKMIEFASITHYLDSWHKYFCSQIALWRFQHLRLLLIPSI